MFWGDDLKDKVEEVLKEIRPIIQADGGDVELIDVTEAGTVHLRLQGVCSACPSSIMTLRQGIERLLIEQIPEVRKVVAL